MIGALMLVALLACGVAVALWDRETVVLDFPPEERAVHVVAPVLDGYVSVMIRVDFSQLRAAIVECGRLLDEFGKTLAEQGSTIEEFFEQVRRAEEVRGIS